MQNQRDEEAQTPDRDSNEPQQRPSPRCSKLKEGHTGGRAHWKPGPSDRVRQYLLSEQFQASIQLALSRAPHENVYTAESCFHAGDRYRHVRVVSAAIMQQKYGWKSRRLALRRHSFAFPVSVLLPVGVLLISIFLFVEQLYFTEASIGAVVVTIAMILASLDLTAGGRIFGAAMLSSAAWAALLGGIIVSLTALSQLPACQFCFAVDPYL